MNLILIRMLCSLLLFRPLQRMVAGMLFAALAFVVAGLLQLKIDVSSLLFKQMWRRAWKGTQWSKWSY